MVMMTEEGSTKIVNFMTPGVGVPELRCGHISYILKIFISLKIFFLLYSQAQIRQSEGIVMMFKEGEGSTKIVNFFTLRAGIFVLGRGHITKLSIRFGV